MEKVLLLGGSLHLQTFPAEGFGTPISHNNPTQPTEHYHRAVFHCPCETDVVDRVWYVYVTDEYQTSPGQLTRQEIHEALEERSIRAHIESVPLVNLQHERHVL